MGKKKRTQVFVLKPWCWYCEREFEDEKVLLQHQKSKHFKCTQCPRKLNTAGGLMVHSQQVHKCEPEPLTNTLPGRDGYDIEIFGMEGVPTNALAEWKARKESEAGTAAMASAAAAKRPRQAYTVIAEADLVAALAQHKALMAARNNPAPAVAFPPFAPPPFPGMPPPSFAPPFPPGFPPPGVGAPPFPPPPGNFMSPYPPAAAAPPPAASLASQPPPSFVPQSTGEVANIQPPKDGVMWPDASASPAEKRAQQPRYRYASPSSDDSRKRKAE